VTRVLEKAAVGAEMEKLAALMAMAGEPVQLLK
jgi:hypothetical protein